LINKKRVINYKEVVEQSDIINYDIEKDNYALYIMTTLKDEKGTYYVDVVKI